MSNRMQCHLLQSDVGGNSKNQYPVTARQRKRGHRKHVANTYTVYNMCERCRGRDGEGLLLSSLFPTCTKSKSLCRRSRTVHPWQQVLRKSVQSLEAAPVALRWNHPSILEDRTGSLKSGWLTPAIGRNGLIIVLCFCTVLVKLFFFVFRSYGCAHMAMVGLPVTVALHACFRCLCTIWRSIPIYSLSSDQMCKSFPTTWTWVKSKPWANQSLVNFSC